MPKLPRWLGGPRKKASGLELHQDSRSAWDALCRIGGIERDERDFELEEALRLQLDPAAISFDQALSTATTDELVQALMSAAAPFAAMFQDILAYFRRAGANQGNAHWRIAIGQHMPDLKEFEEFLEIWGMVETSLHVPAIDVTAKRALRDAMVQSTGVYGRPGESGIAEVDAWLVQYRGGYFPAFPSALQPGLFPPAIADAATIAQVTLARMRDLWPDRSAMMEAYGEYLPGTHVRAIGYEASDAFHPGTIAQDETDYWLGSAIQHLARLRGVDRDSLSDVNAALERAYADLLLRAFRFETQAARLQRLLSLPVWRQRHEVYAIWICTEIVEALAEHEVELHHEERKLLFAFRKTLLATVRTSRPPMHLFAERRIPLANPAGKKRKGHVQPDYSLWSDDGTDICRLVVEVKHYRKAKQRDFNAVLLDYARAHPGAQVALVNYGPLGPVPDLGDRQIMSRCRQIGELTPMNVGQRDQFRKLVLEIVGPPVWPELLVLDISETMARFYAGAGFWPWFIPNWVTPAKMARKMVVLADNEVRAWETPFWTSKSVHAAPMDQERDLAGVLLSLHTRAMEFIVVTDRTGLEALLVFPEHRASRLPTNPELWLVRIASDSI